MGQTKDSGDKTEKPTPKKLKDARKKGDVAKSKDIGAAFTTLTFCLLFAVAIGYGAHLVAEFAEQSVDLATKGEFATLADRLGSRALWLMVGLSALILAPLAAIGLAVEFLQTGPILTGEKIKPSLDKLNPIEGLKRMFGKDGLVELVKMLMKVIALTAVTAIVFATTLESVGELTRQALFSETANGGVIAGERTASYFYSVTLQLLVWCAFLFLAIALLDRIHQQHSFIKKMRMSRRDIKKEHKDEEGDPMVRSERRQMHQQWAENNAAGATAGASALLVNPTHIAIALDHDPDSSPIPVIAAKGMGPLAQLMREVARDEGVPIVRNVAVARSLNGRCEVGEMVPEDMFEAIAEIILWARRARAKEAPMEQELGREPLAFEDIH
ncbi:EscU/YscU/HrcU family type III secretion system export apparatus switch protein [Qipengyuania qiaonensis]|uniref:EscU/YscU/HrcU family type III secretion system export apparatus switch protein n=1 Tax=Qipengyuania qiaonensis TaxID=2867240 RepID=A0ABS7J5Y3_9SPHN|nr:EscU/YscU/HrcU family type III secretion system export apparatus switch protein [Qipengyuania qiaonensis]MBX7482738.1 EscU/YscU/HrcU family type III secretion system export apparatus switch protein [Qipengyuania qiaonensis]